MYGDYSRGHEPDRKRGRNYRRVLLQMGRPVLDSDVASMVDAVLGEVRATTRGLGCAAGSPDLGFLVTPGRLLTVFAEALDGLTVAQGTPDAWIDYRFRFAGRYPALHVAATGGPARVTLPLLQPLDLAAGPARAALWARVEAPTTIQVNGIAVNLTPDSPDEPQRVEFATGVATLDPLDIALGAGEEVWLFLLEQDEAAGDEPAFWVAPGSYHVDGLVADARGGGTFPSITFPDAAGFPWSESPVPPPPLDGLLGSLGPGGRFVAYLEVWERHITAVEDPGIREEALGAADTCARTELVGQVKLATLTGMLPTGGAAAAGVLRAAFDDVEVSGGQLTVEVPETTPTTDPCALPDLAGYSGSDNRLYRVEVHQGGGLSQVRLKWSRDNGSELFAARLDETQNLVFDPGMPLAAGDIVEVLSHVVDLGDDSLASVSAGGFVPPRRAVGQLAQLAAVDVDASSDEVVFRLVDPDDVATPVTLDDRYGTLPDAVLKLRRWHGILDPQLIAGGGGASAGPHVLEDGITVELSSTGSYRPGQWWQYEARVRGENANGPWRPDPHGPERRFAPLALLEYQAANQPLRLLAWLDERFSHPCDLDADGVAFAGSRVGSASDTVQEAIEELFERPPEIVDASCGELIVRPENGDLQTVFDTIADGENRRICFQPGEWVVEETVTIANKGDLVISGAGGASRLGGDVDSVLRFSGCGHVRIQDLTVEGGRIAAVGDGLAGAISAIDCEGFDLERVEVSCGGSLTRRVSAVEVRTGAPTPSAPKVRVRDCRIEVGHAQVGVLVVNASSVDIEGNTIVSPEQALPLASTLSEPEIAGRVGRLLIRDTFIGETAEANDELLVGSPDILVQVSDPIAGPQRFIVHLESWGYQFITFTSTLSLGAAQWRALFEANPIPGDFSSTPAGPGVVARSLRTLRRQVVNSMFGLPSTATVPASVQPTLASLAATLSARNAFSAGDQGIVLAGTGTAIDPAFPEPRVLTGTQLPDARIVGNRVLGFVQGIHVGTSFGAGGGLSYRVTVADNTVHLRAPSLARDRHGIFVGDVFHLRLHGNIVEVRAPGPADWSTAGPLDAIRVFGTFGPMVRVQENSCIGTRNGVVAHAVNRTYATTPGWRWAVSNNAHVGSGGGVVESFNW